MSLIESEGHLSLWRHDMRPMSKLTMANIAERIAEKHRLTVADLKSISRKHKITRPRQEAMYEMMQTGKWSSVRIGMFLGGRDHSTVLFGIKAHARRMAD
jgi:chromosomal replication initiator protein